MFGRRFALFCGVAASALLGPGPAAAAEEIPNCYVERIPCGTPERLAETIRRCIAVPALCGAEGRLPVVRREAAPRPSGQAPDAASGAAQARSRPGAQADPAVERLARNLPLQPGLRDLRDAAPADSVAVIRQLGLRPSSAPATDLRDRIPSVEELLLALLP